MWVPQNQATPGYVSVSRHGQYATRPWNSVPNKAGVRVRAIYHKDGGSTHIMRCAGSGEQPEAWGGGRWDEPALLSWTNLRNDLRDKLNNASWGDANFPLRDGRFPDRTEPGQAVRHPIQPQRLSQPRSHAGGGPIPAARRACRLSAPGQSAVGLASRHRVWRQWRPAMAGFDRPGFIECLRRSRLACR